MSLLTQGPGNWLTAALQFLIDLQKQVPAGWIIASALPHFTETALAGFLQQFLS
jgi:hypothetical protein